jgi:hypothetical protein
MLMFAFAGFVGAAQAADFDEAAKAPKMKSAADLKTRAQSFTARHAQVRAANPLQLIKNSALARQQFDLKWQIQHTINERTPPAELAELGINSQGDGSFAIDMPQHPEWDDIPESMTSLYASDSIDFWTAELPQRGFRPEDVETFRNYISTHDPAEMRRVASLPIALKFGQVIRKFDKLKKPVPESLVVSFWYQSARAASEVNRAWAADFLNQFDAQRARILLAVLLEMDTKIYWIPDDLTEGISETLAQVRRTDFEQRVRAEAKGVAP